MSIIGAVTTSRAKWVAAAMGVFEQDRAAHRMGQREPGLRAGEQRHLRQKDREIALILREVVDMALARIGEFALRTALAAPVQRDDLESARQQVVDGLEIFFDEFGASLKQRDRRARRAGRRKARHAQRHIVHGVERVNPRAGRNGISRRGYEVEHRAFLRLRKASGADSAAARSIFTIVQPNGR